MPPKFSADLLDNAPTPLTVDGILSSQLIDSSLSAALRIYRLAEHEGAKGGKPSFFQFGDEIYELVTNSIDPHTLFGPPVHFLAWFYMKKYSKQGGASLISIAQSIPAYLEGELFIPAPMFPDPGMQGASLPESEMRREQLASAKHIINMLLSSDQDTLPTLFPFIEPAVRELHKRSEQNILQRVSEYCQLGKHSQAMMNEASAMEIAKLLVFETEHEFGLHTDDFRQVIELAKKLNGAKPSVLHLIRHFEQVCSFESGSWLEILSTNASSSEARRLAAVCADRVWSEIERREMAMSAVFKPRPQAESKPITQPEMPLLRRIPK